MPCHMPGYHIPGGEAWGAVRRMVFMPGWFMFWSNRFLTFVCILGQTQERGWSFSCPCLASYARHRLLNVVLPEANGNRQLWHIMDILILGLGAALQCGSWKQKNATAVVCCHCLKTSKTFHFCNKTHTCTCIFSKSCSCHFEKLQLQFLVVSCRVAVQLPTQVQQT